MAESVRRRFSIRNLSFKKSKKQNSHHSKSTENIPSSSAPKVNQSSTVRCKNSGRSVSAIASTEPRRGVRTAQHKRSSVQVDWNATDAWNKPVIGQAIWPFEAILRCDLTFEAGDKIFILTRTSKQYDWWEGTVRGHTGIFPANYIRVLE